MKAVFIALLAALIGSSFARPVLPANAGALKEEVLHSFCSQARCADGAMPAAGLIFVNGLFYGTTASGGIGGRHYIVPFGGTAFSFEPNPGAESVLFTFCVEKSCAYGNQPAAGLTDADDVLYGTTYWGGLTSLICDITCGTAFSLDPETGAETLLYTFCSQPKCADGGNPSSGLIDVAGILYGETDNGGTGDGEAGTVFSIDPITATTTVLYSFCSQRDCTDGMYPGGGVINVSGTLYGTTAYGGANGGGTVFAVDPGTGSESVLYSFCGQSNCTDGEIPGALIDVNGVLYGTTYEGGGNGCGGLGCGTVFSVDINSGTEKVLHYFAGKPDGEWPVGGLIFADGILYGTTTAGGGSDKGGTVFSIDPATGTLTVLYSFCSQPKCVDGSEPFANLTAVDGMLYGTTIGGGAYGNGTLFVLR